MSAIAFVIAAPLAITAFNIDHRVLSAPVWLEAADEADLYEALPNIVATQLRAPDGPYAHLPDEDISQIATAGVPLDVVRPVFIEAITQLVAFGRAERDDVVVSMSDFKREMQIRFPAAMLALIADKPVCASREDYGSFTCRPRPADQAEFEQVVRDNAARAWGELPDTYTFVSADTFSPGEREIHGALVRIMKFTPYIVVLVLVLIGGLAVRGVRGFLLWIGLPLFLAGLLTFGCWMLSGLIEGEVLRSLAQDRDASSASPVLTPVFESVLDQFVSDLLIWAIVVAATGFGMTIAGSFMSRTETEDAA